MCVNGWESENAFNVNAYESEYPKYHESGNIDESGKLSLSINVVSKGINKSVGGVTKRFCMRRLYLIQGYCYKSTVYIITYMLKRIVVFSLYRALSSLFSFFKSLLGKPQIHSPGQIKLIACFSHFHK